MSDSPSSLRSFSQIFIETDALDHPNTKSILSRLNNPYFTEISHYKDIFNRKNQNFALQKNSPRAILAIKEPPFIYPFDDFIQEYDRAGFYVSLAKNCLYDCEYCYLRQNDGGDIVLFVNSEDMLEAAKDLKSDTRVSISYDSDILALEPICGYISSWIEFAKNHPDKQIELRTKCADISTLLDYEIPRNFQVAFTILPTEIHKQYEHKTPSVKKRVASAKKLLEKGVSVMICIDPIIEIDGSFCRYVEFIDELKLEFKDMQPEFSLGVFRMGESLMKSIRKKGFKSELLYRPYIKIEDEMSYEREKIEELFSTLEQKIKESFQESSVYKPKFKKGA